MQSLQLSGSYFDVGYSNGIALKELGFVPPRANSVEIRFARQCVPEIKRSFPEVLEEIEGLGFALKSNYKDILAMVLTNGVVSGDHSVVFAAGSGSGSKRGVLLARNYNRHKKFANQFVQAKTRPSRAYASLANTDTAVGRQDGMNSEGLAVAGSGVLSGPVRLGMSPTLSIRHVLDKAGTVGDAVELLSNTKHARGFNFVVADRSGKIALVEAGAGSVTARAVEGRFIAATNHFQTGNDIKAGDTVTRHKRLSALIGGTERLNAESAMRILSDHGGICEHPESSEFKTVWSSVFSTKDGTLTASEGNPCTSKYREFKI
jgi:predicted choloylglycine hydrolase